VLLLAGLEILKAVTCQNKEYTSLLQLYMALKKGLQALKRIVRRINLNEQTNPSNYMPRSQYLLKHGEFCI
jgi:hypothetical protein